MRRHARDIDGDRETELRRLKNRVEITVWFEKRLPCPEAVLIFVFPWPPPLFRSSLPPRLPLSRLANPSWLKVKAPGGPNYVALKEHDARTQLHTVCEERIARNRRVLEHKAATFMILGDVCTRNCAYCAVAHGTPARSMPASRQRSPTQWHRWASSTSSLRVWIATTCRTVARGLRGV